MENLVPLSLVAEGKGNEWIVLTYEELVLNSERIIGMLAEKLELQDKDRMLAKIRRPSKTTKGKSKEYIQEKGREHLIKRWKESVSEEEEQLAFEILERFVITAYQLNRFLPAVSLLNFPEDLEVMV